jgi:hypothetical protein
MRQSLNISGTLSRVFQDRRGPRRGVLSLALLAMMLGSSLFAQTQITTGSGNIGVAATESQLLFTQPFCSTDALGTLPVARGVYSVNTTTGAASLYASIPTPSTTISGLFCAEMYIAIAQIGNLGSFAAGSAYVTQGPAIYVVPPGGGAATPMTITGAPLVAPFGHSGIGFDLNGHNLIYTSAFGVWMVTSAGVATKVAPGINPSAPVLIESPSVSASGVLYVTGEDETDPPGAGRGPLSGLYFLTGGVLTAIPGGATASGPTQSPESINFVPSAPCSLTIKGVAYGAFLSVFSQTTVGLLQPTTSVIDGFLFSLISAQTGKGFETFEYAGTSGFATGQDIKIYDPVADAFTPFADVPNQLEGFNLVTCGVPPPPPPPPGTGCPATQGFWHKAANWPAVHAVVDGIVYNGATDFSMVIGGITYTRIELLQVMPSGGLHSGNYANSLSQLIAAVLNVAAGAQHTASADAAIASDQAALAGVQIFCGAGLNTLCPVSPAVVSAVEANLTALDNYNSALGLGCTEGAGLTIGSGKNSK